MRVFLVARQVYTFRALSRALPQVKTSDQANKNEVYEKSYQVLAPEVEKLKAFMLYVKRAVAQWATLVGRCVVTLREEQPSEQLIWALIQMTDQFALLDELKNMKTFNNDLS